MLKTCLFNITNAIFIVTTTQNTYINDDMINISMLIINNDY